MGDGEVRYSLRGCGPGLGESCSRLRRQDPEISNQGRGRVEMERQGSSQMTWSTDDSSLVKRALHPSFMFEYGLLWD